MFTRFLSYKSTFNHFQTCEICKLYKKNRTSLLPTNQYRHTLLFHFKRTSVLSEGHRRSAE
ncbi:hypothetical protein Hanom_Chr17g01542321 [Helianthus anomalus]